MLGPCTPLPPAALQSVVANATDIALKSVVSVLDVTEPILQLRSNLSASVVEPFRDAGERLAEASMALVESQADLLTAEVGGGCWAPSGGGGGGGVVGVGGSRRAGRREGPVGEELGGRAACCLRILGMQGLGACMPVPWGRCLGAADGSRAPRTLGWAGLGSCRSSRR